MHFRLNVPVGILILVSTIGINVLLRIILRGLSYYTFSHGISGKAF